MPVPVTTIKDLCEHLTALGVSRGDKITVHSRLIAFGRIDHGAASVFDALCEILGAQGTIVVPTYTLFSTGPYDKQNTPSQAVGVLSEHIRTLPGAIRSACPLHSHAGIGPGAQILAEGDGRVSFGVGSDFELLQRHNFKLLLLGASFAEGATCCHHLEAIANVPYRAWTTVRRKVVSADGSVAEIGCRYFERSDQEWHEDFNRLAAPLEEAGIVSSARCPFGNSYYGSLRDIADYVLAQVSKNPYALVKRCSA